MGCDGGTIPRRDELVRVKKKPEQVNIFLLLIRIFCVILSVIVCKDKNLTLFDFSFSSI